MTARIKARSQRQKVSGRVEVTTDNSAIKMLRKSHLRVGVGNLLHSLGDLDELRESRHFQTQREKRETRESVGPVPMRWDRRQSGQRWKFHPAENSNCTVD